MANTQIVDVNQLPSFIKSIMAQVSQPDTMPGDYEGDTVPQTIPVPNMAAASGVQQQPQNPLAPVGDIAQSMTGEQTAPNLRASMYTADAGGPVKPTKANKLLQILMGGIKGGAAGAGQRTFGQGFQQAQELPLQVQGMQLANQRTGLENQQLWQQLPFLRSMAMANLQKTIGETQKIQGEIEGMPAKQALEQAQALAARYKEDPGSGSLIDLQTGQPVSTQGVAPLTADEAKVLGKNPGDRVPIKLKNTANEIAMRGITTVNTEQGVYERNRQTGTMTRLGSNPRNVFAPENRIIQVADPNNPGQTIYTTAGNAMRQGLAGTQSASLVVPKNVLKWATTGEGGKMAGAFNTAMQHADLLEQALTALDNGDTRALNSLKNSFKTAFGSSDMTNFKAIANAYSREITKMLSAGHLTDSEINSAEATLPSNASPEQILGAIHAYRALAGSKMNILYDQFNKGMQGQPNFQRNNTGKADPLGIL